MNRRTGLLIFCALSTVASVALVLVFVWGATRLAEGAVRPRARLLFYVGACVGTMAGLMFYNAILSLYSTVRLTSGSMESRRARVVLGLALCVLFIVIFGGSYLFLRSEKALWDPAAVRQQTRERPAPRAEPRPGRRTTGKRGDSTSQE